MNTTQHPSLQAKAKISIAGAGPVGALLATILSRANYQVNIFESRADFREQKHYQGKSINLALSDRAWRALDIIGATPLVKEHAIPLYQRIVHTQDNSQISQNYGDEQQAIWAISRVKLNEILLAIAEQEPLVNLTFNNRLTHLDFINGCSVYANHSEHIVKQQEVESDLTFAADGAYSKVRRLAQETPRFSYSQHYMEQCYIELTINAHDDGSHKLDKNALHIWPRKHFLMIALPNSEGSFTCTLFLNHDGEPSFSSLQEKEDIKAFLSTHFADVYPMLNDPVEAFSQKAANPLFLVSVAPWVFNNKVALIGDAAHAMVPFYGQGLNCSFEDCREIAELITMYQDDWEQILPAYQKSRKENTDAISKLAKEHFQEISEFACEPRFILKKRIEAKFHKMYPELWTPLYTMISFSADLPYSRARQIGKRQDALMEQIMLIKDIEKHWQEDFVYEKLKNLVKQDSKTFI